MSLERRALVIGDALDEEACEQALAGSERLQAVVARGARLMPDFEALTRDLFVAFYKMTVTLRPSVGLRPSERLRARVLEEITGAASFVEAAQHTALDASRAGVATLRTAQAILALLKSERLLLSEEMREGFELAQGEAEADALAGQLESAEALAWTGVDADALADAVEALRSDADRLEERRATLEDAAERAAEEVPSEAFEALHTSIAKTSEQMAEAAEMDAVLGDAGGEVDLDALALRHELAETPGIQAILRLAGALRADALAVERKRVPRAKTEIYGVTRGADPARLLPVELTGLRHPVLAREFRRRFVERSLLGYRLRGDEREGRGALVILLDVSGSMAGRRIVWAKAVALTLAEVARRQRRHVALFSFSSGAHSVARIDLAVVGRNDGCRAQRLPDGLIRLMKLQAGGGTDFEAPVAAALALIESETRCRRADIVIVTDGQARVSAELQERIRSRKQTHDTELLGVHIDEAENAPSDSLESLCDAVIRVSELNALDARDVLRKLRR